MVARLSKSKTPVGGEMRTPEGGRINRSKPLSFTFDGRAYSGFEGDTLASALIANGIHLVGRSFKYHRPRGIMTAGSEEPNALVRLGEGSRIEPNTRATQIELYPSLKSESQNRWPSLGLDAGSLSSFFHRILPAAFYYKTFMWPAGMWKVYEHFIRRAAGLGKAAKDHNDPDRYEKTHMHIDILVVGGGASGLMAALSAARSGLRVMLADEQNELGGWLLSEQDTLINDGPADLWIADMVELLEAMDNVTILKRTTAFGYMDHNYITLMERVTDHLGEPPAHLPRQRMYKIRAREVVLAQGSHERPLVFGGNDRPGVMLSSAVRSYINRYGVRPGNRAVLITNNDDAYRTAFALADAGVFVRAIIDMRPVAVTLLASKAMQLGIAVYTSHTILDVEGARQVGRIKAARIDPGTAEVTDEPFYLDCDLLAMSGGFTPVVNLHSQSRGGLEWDEKHLCFRPSTTHEACQSAGACNGIFELIDAMADGAKVGIEAAMRLGKSSTTAPLPKVNVPIQDHAPLELWDAASDATPGAGPKAFIDFQNDVTASDIKLAVREGYHSVEHVKRYTTTGMATDQGKMSNINALGVMAGELGEKIPDIGTTTFRMPYTPTTLGGIAGRDVGHLFDPVRTTRIDPWHRENGAEFEHVGQWMRAWYYPKPGETMKEAVQREALAARTTAGLLDASTLGKIDICGRDAAEFLNRIYTNSWKKLPVGNCRYGLMLKDDGMVMDDGVTSRLGENHFHMTTTTGGAAPVLDWLEEWHQTEWPDLEVYMTSVTEQWSVVTLTGPLARKILEKMKCSIPLDNDSFPFMSFKDATLLGLPVRIFRISFTGELSYEINTPASLGLALWKNLMDAGEEFGITPYGTETMHLLRAEKGFIIVGQETDGSVTPQDLGMDWIVSKVKPDYIGKRALERASMSDKNRKQLVGLLTDRPKVVIPEGAHAVLDHRQPKPMEMLGQVTSSYYSPNLKHSIALALIKDGRAMKGQTVYFPMINFRWPIKATITDPVFFDPKGKRING
jgi:sarcosine oxidase subunit alpha